MKTYLAALREVLEQGTMTSNRTGTNTITKMGVQIQHDLSTGFPVLTTKKVNYSAAIAELCGFIRGFSNSEDFAAIGCPWWGDNANKEPKWLANPNRKGQNDLGRIYGVQWRSWNDKIDQLSNVMTQLRQDPTSRQIILTGWNPEDLDKMALPPCHTNYHFNVIGTKLHVTMWQRSGDMFLGVPMNIVTTAALTHLIADLAELEPGSITLQISNAHIYENHIEQVKIQLTREPMVLPTFRMSDFLGMYVPTYIFDKILPQDFIVENYISHGALKGKMAI